MELISVLLLFSFILSLIGTVIFIVFTIFSFVENENLLGCLWGFFTILCLITMFLSYNSLKSLQENQTVNEYNHIQNNEYILIDKESLSRKSETVLLAFFGEKYKLIRVGYLPARDRFNESAVNYCCEFLNFSFECEFARHFVLELISVFLFFSEKGCKTKP